MISIEKIKKLREETGLSISECQKALKEAKGNLEKAKEILRKLGKDFAQKRKEKEAKSGIIESYIHPGKKIGVMVELHCESDFVANSEDFQKLAHELCLQIAAIDPKENPLFDQPYIRDEKRKVKDLFDEAIAKFGENIILKNFVRFEI